MTYLPVMAQTVINSGSGTIDAKIADIQGTGMYLAAFANGYLNRYNTNWHLVDESIFVAGRI
jgi:hypothetical protein